MLESVQTGPFGVNTYLVPLAAGYCFVTDPAGCEACGDREVLPRALEKQGLKCLCAVFTHGHFDHVSGMKSLKEKWPEMPVLIHQGDLPFVTGGEDGIQAKMLYGMGMSSLIPEFTDMPQIDCFLKEDKSLLDCLEGNGCLVGLEDQVLKALAGWKVIHTPGHSEGSVCLYNQEKSMLISGDTVFYHSWGRTDFAGGSESQMNSSLNFLYGSLPGDTRVFPGHDHYGFRLSENL